MYASGNKLTLNVSSCWTPPFSLYAMELNNWNLGHHFPIWLKSQKSISQITMSNTGISDVIPSWLWNISSSFDLSIDLSENQIYGEILEFPNDGSYMLNLNSNKLTGPLPRIPVYFSLDLSNNSLSGNISNFLCDRKSRTRYIVGLNLANNFLSGKIPDCWMYWPSLINIDLDNNNLTGKIPSSIGSLQSLESLHLHNNSLTGEIPKALKNCTTLIGLDLGFNKLVGTIPRWIESIPFLGLLVLRSNNLIGLIPVELCKLSTLQLLDASNNNLTGIIPRCFKNLTVMTSRKSEMLHFSYYSSMNHESRENANLVIKGRENQYNTILYLLSTLDLSANQLSGKIPEELTSLDALYSLNLSGNYLSGSIPKKIDSMTALESLDLSRNRLSGHIPSGMASLTFLSFLNLSYNNLSGQIPTSTQLQTMDASGFIGNKLCGPPLLIKCREDHVTLNRMQVLKMEKDKMMNTGSDWA
ncbi:receptor-like protein EIX2 [Humulus lupulus]|uniref:receptor-like protein EIX2 n=1 Tax=Humulus lupulus TaxID=3486 RepID=UPI002B40C15A|nr:receptor-like protein EIX2 [Humulus lupulus]